MTQAAWQQRSVPQRARQVVTGEAGAVEVIISEAEEEGDIDVVAIEEIEVDSASWGAAAAKAARPTKAMRLKNCMVKMIE